IPGVIGVLGGFAIFPKYAFSQFILIIVLIAVFNFVNVLFLNICRTYSLFKPISVFQLLIQLLQLPMVFVLRDMALVWGLLLMMLLSHLISLFVFVRSLPFKLRLKPDPVIIRRLYNRGISLLAYAITFYILLLSTKSIVGHYYPVATMGYLTFAANIASALIVGLSSLDFVLFPKMINRLGIEEMSES